jgi:hypothetical protein
MPADIYELQEWESWEIPGEHGRPSNIRITTDTVLPFDTPDLLQVVSGPEGLEFQARDSGVTLVLTPLPGPVLVLLFAQCVDWFLPVVLTEVNFPAKTQRSWLATPRRARK